MGNLMVLLQIGSMPHELTLENIDLFARKVLPDLRGIWNRGGLGESLVAREPPRRAGAAAAPRGAVATRA